MPFAMCLYSILHKLHSSWDLVVLQEENQLNIISLTGKAHSVGFHAAIIHQD